MPLWTLDVFEILLRQGRACRHVIVRVSVALVFEMAEGTLRYVSSWTIRSGT